jgi:hypothetical protein
MRMAMRMMTGILTRKLMIKMTTRTMTMTVRKTRLLEKTVRGWTTGSSPLVEVMPQKRMEMTPRKMEKLTFPAIQMKKVQALVTWTGIVTGKSSTGRCTLYV